MISKYVGIPYKPRGRTKEGLDCYGLAICLFKERGIELPDPFYPDTETSTNKKVMESLESTIPNTKIDKPEPWCIIEFLIKGEPSHIGIYLGRGEFIHSSCSTGVVVDKLYRWEKKVKGYYRI